jgi:hypothetical protein
MPGARCTRSPVGWVEPFAKPIIFARQLAIDGYRFAPPILRAVDIFGSAGTAG